MLINRQATAPPRVLWLCDVRGCPHGEEVPPGTYPPGWKLKRANGGRHADICGECSALFNADLVTHEDIGWMRRQRLRKPRVNFQTPICEET